MQSLTDSKHHRRLIKQRLLSLISLRFEIQNLN